MFDVSRKAAICLPLAPARKSRMLLLNVSRCYRGEIQTERDENEDKRFVGSLKEIVLLSRLFTQAVFNSPAVLTLDCAGYGPSSVSSFL